LAPFPALLGLPPSQKDQEHAPDSHGDPKDPEEETPRYLRHVFEPDKGHDKIQEEEKQEPSDPSPKAFTHHSTSSVTERILIALQNSPLLEHFWEVQQENREVYPKQGPWSFIIDYFRLIIYNVIHFYLVKHRYNPGPSLAV